MVASLGAEPKNKVPKEKNVDKEASDDSPKSTLAPKTPSAAI